MGSPFFLCACVQTPIRTGAAVQEKIHRTAHPISGAAPHFAPVHMAGRDGPRHALRFRHTAADRCHRISRSQQISANFLAAATRATLTPARLRIR